MSRIEAATLHAASDPRRTCHQEQRAITSITRTVIRAGWIDRGARIAGGLTLLVAYVRAYLIEPQRPGNELRYPLGWLGFHDQGLYWLSARSLSVGDLAATHHWYPLGYPLVIAPFVKLMPLHAFAIPDGIALLGTYFAFLSFARRVGVGSILAVAAFLVATLSRRVLMDIWVLPWTTTLSAPLIWSLLALSAAELAGEREETVSWRRALAAGFLAGAIPLVRPADAVLVAIWVAFMLAGLTHRREGELARVATLTIGGVALSAVPYGVLHLVIYGPHPTGYMIASGELGFRWGALPWKLYTLLIDPRPWYPDGRGMVERLCWLLPGFAGMVLLPALPRGPDRCALTMLATMIVATIFMLSAYVDLLPTGLWLYGNVHYFKWVFPGLALFAALLLRRLAYDFAPGSRRTRWAAPAAFAVVVALTVPRPVPVQVAGDRRAWMLQYDMPTPGWLESYFGREAVVDRLGVLRNIFAMRALPDSTGLRLISQSRPFSGNVAWVSGDLLHGLPVQPDRRWRMVWRLGEPCWLPSRACRREHPAP